MVVAAGLVGWWVACVLYRYAPGQDLMVFATAGRLAAAGDWRTLADGDAFTALLERTHAGWLHGPLIQHPWMYPPSVLPLAELVGAVPFGVAYPGLEAGSLALLGAVLWRCWPAGGDRRWGVGLALLSPATAWCLGAGQVSFLVAAAAVSGLWLLPRRPVAAGLVLSVLTLKPQFALLVPAVLAAGGSWRALGAFVAGAAWWAALPAALYGLEVWGRWLHLMLGGDPAFARWESVGRLGGDSLDAYARALGAGAGTACLVQLVGSVLTAVAVGRVFAGRAGEGARLCAFLLGCVAGAPHMAGYDNVLAAIAVGVVLTREEWGRTSRVLALVVWVGSVLTPPAVVAQLGVPALTVAAGMTPVVTLALIGVLGGQERPARTRVNWTVARTS